MLAQPAAEIGGIPVFSSLKAALVFFLKQRFHHAALRIHQERTNQ
jgi:hypothetical protein